MDEFGNMISNLYEKATAELEKNKKIKLNMKAIPENIQIICLKILMQGTALKL